MQDIALILSFQLNQLFFMPIENITFEMQGHCVHLNEVVKENLRNPVLSHFFYRNDPITPVVFCSCSVKYCFDYFVKIHSKLQLCLVYNVYKRGVIKCLGYCLQNEASPCKNSFSWFSVLKLLLSKMRLLNPYAAGGYFGQYKMMQKSWKMIETWANGYSFESTQ